MANEFQSSKAFPNAWEIPLPEIDSKLATLKKIETDLSNEEVEKAKKAMHRVFDPEFSDLDAKGIIITCHGSLQFNDPRNLDADIELVGERLSYKDVESIIKGVDRELKKPGVWPRPNCDTNISFLSLETIEKGLRHVGQKEHFDPSEEEDYSAHTEAALLLSSAVLYKSQEPKIKILRNKVRKLIAENSWLREGVKQELADVIKTRQKRRGQIE